MIFKKVKSHISFSKIKKKCNRNNNTVYFPVDWEMTCILNLDI